MTVDYRDRLSTVLCQVEGLIGLLRLKYSHSDQRVIRELESLRAQMQLAETSSLGTPVQTPEHELFALLHKEKELWEGFLILLDLDIVEYDSQGIQHFEGLEARRALTLEEQTEKATITRSLIEAKKRYQEKLERFLMGPQM